MANDEVEAMFIVSRLIAVVKTIMTCQTALLVLLIAEERRRRQMIQANLIQTNNLLLNCIALPQSTQRKVWMKIRSKMWWERDVLTLYDDEDWKNNFRMTRGSFQKLCGVMEGIMKPEEVTVRAPIPLEMRVAIVLYKLASCAEYRIVAKKFGVHKSTVKKMVYQFCRGMVTSALQNFIKVPTTEEAISIASRFEQKFHIPQIIGCIDGTHIPVLPPTDGHKYFVNRKGWPSYVLQAVVDDMYRFWNINCKMPGCSHNADVLRQSTLFSEAHLLPKELREVNGVSINHFLLGDPAYPLLDWLMKGYTHSPNITPEQESFNVYLSSARTTVEIAFGRLKSRWRVLLKHNNFHFSFTPKVIATCCALHNFCENEKEDINPNWLVEAATLESDVPQPGIRANNCTDSTNGQRIRAALTDYLSANFPLRRS
ncbi:hypothetical protein ACEWY4_013610 [Coilia grayii]|uniref:DDE Tnp4 domain-containing protein n=1 Tax=Coilia grayii TaxID=363190 RepID=A0ABD1JWU5_9TELE